MQLFLFVTTIDYVFHPSAALTFALILVQMEETQWGGQLGPDSDDLVSYEEAVKEGERRIIFTGPRR